MRFNQLVAKSKYWTTVIISTLILGTGWILFSRIPVESTTGGAPPPSPREGFSAPGFSIELLDDAEVETFVSLADYRGQVVMINFWATWCTPCRTEMPAIEKVYQEYKDQGFVVLGLNTTFQDSEGEVRAFVNELGLNFPIILDRSGEVSREYQLRGLPSTFFVDRKGVIQSVVIGGPMNEALIQSTVETMLKERP